MPVIKEKTKNRALLENWRPTRCSTLIIKLPPKLSPLGSRKFYPTSFIEGVVIAQNVHLIAGVTLHGTLGKKVNAAQAETESYPPNFRAADVSP